MPFDQFMEPSIAAACLVVLAVYHLHLIRKIRRDPLSTSTGLTNYHRSIWVESVMKERRDILAVQTLRNWSMAASFLASTSILIVMGLLSFLFGRALPPDSSQWLNLWADRGQILWLIKIMLLVLDFFFAFFNFSLSIRYYNHVGLLINVPPERDPLVTPATVAHSLNLGTTHYTMGMRGFYLAVPLVLWLWGPAWLLIGTLGLVLTLYKLDRTV
ncbi:MAG: DUF599 domain-containing protein [Thermodesulfobacteriota bacterium]